MPLLGKKKKSHDLTLMKVPRLLHSYSVSYPVQFKKRMEFSPADLNTRSCYLSLSPYKAEDLFISFQYWIQKEKWHFSEDFQYPWRDYVQSHRNIPVPFLCPVSCIYCKLKSLISNISSKLFHSHRSDAADSPSLPVLFVILPHSLSHFLISCHICFFADPQSVTHSPSLPSCHPISLPTQGTFPLFQTAAASTSSDTLTHLFRI